MFFGNKWYQSLADFIEKLLIDTFSTIKLIHLVQLN